MEVRGWVLVGVCLLVVSQGAQAQACATPANDLYIDSDTLLCTGNYSIADTGATGILIINSGVA